MIKKATPSFSRKLGVAFSWWGDFRTEFIGIWIQDKT